MKTSLERMRRAEPDIQNAVTAVMSNVGRIALVTGPALLAAAPIPFELVI
jgi:hypothetical protein